jgi:Fe-Mn family superoxide dismutase
MGLALCSSGGKLDAEHKSRQSINAGNRLWRNSILGMDVWEHAYYLHYKTEDLIILKLFNTINWTEVSRRYASEK